MLKWLLSLALIFTLFSCKEDTVEPVEYGSIEGIVYDSETQLPLEGASISTSPPTSAVVSAKDGSYKILSIPVGNYTITAKKSGYKKEAVSIAIQSNQPTNAVVFLEKDIVEFVAPSEPVNPLPSSGALNQPTKLSISWSAVKSTDTDTSSFDVFLYESNSAEKIQVGYSLKDTAIALENLKYSTTYFWYVVAKNNSEETTRSDIWTFSTLSRPQNPIMLSYMVNGEYDIYSIGKDGSSLAGITSLRGNELWPRYSPNKRYIAFSADAGTDKYIYVQNLETNVAYKLTNVTVASYNNGGYGFCWSSDGGKIIFGHYEKLYQVDINGANLELIVEAPANRQFRECDYSPSNNKIVAVTIGSNPYDSEIYLIDAKTKTMELLVDNLPGVVECPSFSIDGKQILYTHDISENESIDGRQLNSHIILMTLSSKATTDLSSYKLAGTNDTNPRFSPDGSRIIFNNALNDNSEPSSTWTMDTQGHDRKMLLDNSIMADWR